MNLEEQDKHYVLQTYGRDYTNFVKGVGSTLYDENNRDYIDFGSGIGVNSVGHANPVLTEALCTQVHNIMHISNLQVIAPQVKLAERIVKMSGYDMGIFFANSGAEANEGAIKLARKYGKSLPAKPHKILTLLHSFHGRTLTTVRATGQASFHVDSFAPYPEGFEYKEGLDGLYDAIDEQTVAVMIELIQGEGGVEALDKKAVQDFASKVQAKGVLLIVDEVQTGVYRTGEFLASNLYEIEPDIITLAKGLGGGVPIGAVMSKHKKVLQMGDHGSTFGGNYLSTTAGLAVLEVLEERKAKDLDEMIASFQQKLDALVVKYPALFEKRVGAGLMLGLRAKSAEIQSAIHKASMVEGLVVLKAGRNTVRFLPSLTISQDEIEEGFVRFEKALTAF